MSVPPPYAVRIRADLARVKEQLNALLDISTIRYVNPNTRGSSLYFVTAADWGWGPGDEATTAAQMDLLRRYSDWFDRFVLLLPHPTPDIERKITKADEFVRRWAARDVAFDHSIPQTIEQAKIVAAGQLAVFDELISLASLQGDSMLRVVPDTNALLRNPAVEQYAPALGTDDYLVHVVTTVLAELDELKDRGRTPDVREKATKVIRRLKGFRDRGSLAEGVTVAGKVRLRLEHREVDAASVLAWLDPSVPDDKIIAAALRLQSDHPAGVVVLITADINLQNKADAIGLPYQEPPAPPIITP